MKRYERILSAVMNSPWAILPEKLEQIHAFLMHKVRIEAGVTDTDAGDKDFEAKSRPAASTHGSIAVLPLYGVLAQRMDLMSEISGGTSTERFGKQFTEALNNPNVKAIVIDIDSPGGNVFGTQELADLIYEGRQKKHIVAVANSLAASAAYWIGTSADEFVVTPSGQVGSIGVITMHYDLSEAYAKEGIKPTIIQAGKYKSEGTDIAPLSEEAAEYIQGKVDFYYDAFVGAVARNRGVSVKDVKSNFGQGRVFTSAAAKSAGMVDRIDTLDGVLNRLGANSGNKSGRMSADTANKRLALEME